jgi:hypothetical protein
MGQTVFLDYRRRGGAQLLMQSRRSSYITRGGGNGQGGKERPGWKEGEDQQWKEQQLPMQQ